MNKHWIPLTALALTVAGTAGCMDVIDGDDAAEGALTNPAVTVSELRAAEAAAQAGDR